MDFSGFGADSEQEDNVAGLARMWKVRDKSFVGEYPAKADIVDGEITVSPTVRLPPFFVPAEYVVPQNTAMYSDTLAGNLGYQAYRHVVGYQMAGLSKQLLRELLKDINAGAVYFLEDTNGNINVAGTSKKGLPLNTTGNSGKDGSEQRGKVMAAEEVGFRWPVMPLSDAAKAAFLTRLLGFENLTNTLLTSVTVNWNQNNTFTFPSRSGYTVGDRVKIQFFFGAGHATPLNIVYWGTINQINVSGGQFSFVVFFDVKPAELAHTSYTGSLYRLYPITTNIPQAAFQVFV
jgi:hypothetical protein